MLAGETVESERTLEERVAFLEGRMAIREIFYPTALEEWELNPLKHPERTLEERVSVLERRVEAWSRRPPACGNRLLTRGIMTS
jgi:hypothetical protein